MDQDEIARTTRVAGLTQLLERYPEQLAAALRAAPELARRLPKDFAPAEEPAHTLKLMPSESRR